MLRRFEHVYTYLADNKLEDNLRRFERAGFLVSPNTVRHPKGQKNGFVRLVGGYLELVSVVDENEYQREGSADDKLFRDYPRPFSIGALMEPQTAYEKLRPCFPKMIPPYTRTELTSRQPPFRWEFCDVPESGTPGAHLFGLKYLSPPIEPRTINVSMGGNSIYGIRGLYFCATNWEEKIEIWENTLRLIHESVKRVNNSLIVGFQQLTWISPETYEKMFGESWSLKNSDNGDICAIHLLAQSNQRAEEVFRSGNFALRSKFQKKYLLVKRDEQTGYCFVIEEEPDVAAFTARVEES
jgi:Glyoxalase-like domain